MEFVAWMICLFAALWIYALFSNVRTLKGLPPGPWTRLLLPFMGHLPFLSKARHLSLTSLGNRYGGLFSIKLGSRYLVILSDWKCMKEALITQSDIFSGRPHLFALNQMFKREDIITLDGPLWKSKRRFAMQHLRDFGFGRSSAENIIFEEVNSVMDILDVTNKLEINELFFMPLMNITWQIIGGHRYDYDDEKMLSFSHVLKRIFDSIKSTNLLNGMPWLRFVPGDPAGYRILCENHAKIVRFLEEEIDDHIATFQEGCSPRDFIDVYLGEIFKEEKTLSCAWKTRSHLVGTLFNFFNAGVETTAYTLVWSLMYLALWPLVQDRVQLEIDRVIGSGRKPNYSDRFLMPFTQATLLEVHRYASIVPLSIPHTPTKTTTLLGYTIPKGIVVIQNIWAVHHDPCLWSDPDVFWPHRFLDADGKLRKPEYLIPFSAGGRMCLGEPLASMELFLFFTSLLQSYRFSCVDDERPPSLEPVLSITLRPKPFNLAVKRR